MVCVLSVLRLYMACRPRAGPDLFTAAFRALPARPLFCQVILLSYHTPDMNTILSVFSRSSAAQKNRTPRGPVGIHMLLSGIRCRSGDAEHIREHLEILTVLRSSCRGRGIIRSDHFTAVDCAEIRVDPLTGRRVFHTGLDRGHHAGI